MRDTAKPARPLAPDMDQVTSIPNANGRFDEITYQSYVDRTTTEQFMIGAAPVHQVLSCGPLLYVSPKMAEIVSLIKKYAKSKGTVLITGESGVGKELVALAIHLLSRNNHPFIDKSCAMIPPSLIEGELLGVERGAYTGAERRAGLFELAHRGTLFLDEIGELLLSDQPKFLRLLETHEVVPVGGSRRTKVDVRVIAATNRDLKEAVAKQCFRAELFHRLNVLQIHVPPLRERPEDIYVLLAHFLREEGLMELPEAVLTPKALALLRSYPWPGNARELKNVATRIALHREPRHLLEREQLEPLLDYSVSPEARLEAELAAAQPTEPQRPGRKRRPYDLESIKAWIRENKVKTVTAVCQYLEISRSGWYAREDLRELRELLNGLSCLAL